MGHLPIDDRVSRLKHDQVLQALLQLSPAKQALVVESWPGLSGRTPEGLAFTARTKKEFRRFQAEREPRMMEWLATLRPGDVFYDVGANVGAVTFAVAGMHGDSVAIVAIEPSVGSFESLTRNLASNGLLGFAIPLQAALSSATGMQKLHYTSLEAGTSLHALGAAVDYEGKSFEPAVVQLVPSFRLDDLVDLLGLPRPTHVKVDVDGHEELVLRGARGLLAGCRDIFVEVVDHDGSGTRPRTIEEILASSGFRLVERIPHAKPSIADYLYRSSDG